MKLSLSTDFGSSAHWKRLIAFAQAQKVGRLVFWGDYTNSRFSLPCLYPAHPGLLPDDRRAAVMRLRDRLRRAARSVDAAGLEFWCVYQVLQLPDLECARTAWPELFLPDGEPDMMGPALEQLMVSQLDEMVSLAPKLAGIELWVMECAAVRIAQLRRQSADIPAICERIVHIVWEWARRRGIAVAVDLHTAGGDVATRDGLLAAAARRPEALVGADDTVGDMHLLLPFNPHLRRAAKTNPIQVHFDLNGEFWGRNFVPTLALKRYAGHVEKARALGARYCDGRVSTGHDLWSPHANVLPSRRRDYPALKRLTPDRPLPAGLEISCTDTLGRVNAEYFCRRVKEAATQPETVLRSFLDREFGAGASVLAPAFLKVETILGRLFYAGGNYYGAQSVVMAEWLFKFFGYDEQLVAPVGKPLPTPAMRPECDGKTRAAFNGWPVPAGYRCPGSEALIREKMTAWEEAEALLAEVREKTAACRPTDRVFLIRQFEDLALLARAYRWLLEAQVLTSSATPPRGASSRDRLALSLKELETVATVWEARYECSWYGGPGPRLRQWLERLSSLPDGK